MADMNDKVDGLGSLFVKVKEVMDLLEKYEAVLNKEDEGVA